MGHLYLQFQAGEWLPVGLLLGHCIWGREIAVSNLLALPLGFPSLCVTNGKPKFLWALATVVCSANPSPVWKNSGHFCQCVGHKFYPAGTFPSHKRDLVTQNISQNVNHLNWILTKEQYSTMHDHIVGNVYLQQLYRIVLLICLDFTKVNKNIFDSAWGQNSFPPIKVSTIWRIINVSRHILGASLCKSLTN